MPSQPSGPLRKGDVAAFVPGGVVSSRPVRVLVTGGHGFVGSHLVERLLAGGVEVRCLSRRREVPERLRGLALEVVAGDLETGVGLRAALVGVEEVWHLGALTRSRTRREMLAVNTAGTLRLAREALDLGLSGRFVFCSSLAAVGPATGPHALTEEAPLQPVTTYGLSKRRAEEGLALLGSKLPWVIVRPPAVYGPRDKDFLALFQAAARGLLPFVGSPGRRLSLIHVEDLVAGMLAAGRGEGTVQRAWFVTTDPPVSQTELADGVAVAVGRRPRRLGLPSSAARLLGTLADLGAQLTGVAPLLTRERVREVGEGNWICSGAALARATGWRSSIALGPGLAATASWYRAQGHLM